MRTPDWQSDDGAIQLHCCDCLDLLPTIPTGAVDAVVTDPPYSSGGMTRGDRMGHTSDKYQHGDTGDESRFIAFSGDTRDQRG